MPLKTPAAASSSPGGLQDLLAGARVLIVDDEPVLNLTFSMVLQRAGATTFRAAHGKEALAWIEQEERIDCIVCDKQMPVMDGPALLRELRARGSSVPVLLFVNGIEREELEMLEGLHVRKLLSKPILPVALVQAVADVVRRARADADAP